MCKYAVKIITVVGLLVIAAFLPIVQGCGKSGKKRPNVILISVDTLRADHLGCYGYERDTSPNIDAFAKEGVLFKGAISASNWTAPSHMSIFTSLYPPVHAVNQYPYPAKLKDDIKILPQYFKEAGYFTLGAYDSWYVGEELGFGKGYDSYTRIGPVKDAVEAVLASLDRESGGRPVFLFFHAFDVHEPYMDPERKDPGYDKLYDKDYDGFVVTGSDEENKEILEMRMQGKDVARDVEHSRALYDGAVRYTDKYLGELFKGLRERGLYDDSLIIFLSDHGQEFLDHGRLSHTQLYREIIRVPLIIKPSKGLSGGAEGIKPGWTYEHVVSLVDIMPTLLDLTGIPFNEFHQGVSLRQALAEGKEMGLTAYSSNRFYEDGWPYQRSVMDDRYHFMRSQKNKWHPMFRKGYVEELYSTASDPSEQNDLSKENPGAAEYYLNKVFSWEKEMLADKAKATSDTSEASPVDVSDEQKEQLKALGYVQ